MSRSGFTDDCYDATNWDMIRFAGAVSSTMRGRPGRAFLVELAAALDAMPEKRLIFGFLEDSGEVCALGAVARARGLDVSHLSAIDPDDDGAGAREAANLLGISNTMARLVVDANDSDYYSARDITPEMRWQRVREWVDKQLAYYAPKPPQSTGAS